MNLQSATEQPNAVADYALDPAELSAFRNLLLFQNTSISYRTLSTSDINEFFAWIERLSGCYNGALNAKHKAYYDLVFTPITGMEKLPTMYQVFRYRRYVGPIDFDESDCLFKNDWYSYWITYRQGWYWRERAGDQDMWTRPGIGLPDAPAAWRAKAEALLNGWGENPPGEVINPGQAFNEPTPVRVFEDAVLNGWTAFPGVTALIAPLWEQMKTDVLAIRDSDAPDNRCFFFLLHALIGLGAGNERTANYVGRLVAARTPTEAYPEDTFINQLTYLVLMYLGDPREPDGKYCWSNGQLQAAFMDLRGIIDPARPGSAAILLSINLQLKILNGVAGYPLIDPESSLPLAERKSTTRLALTRTLKSIPFEPNARK